MPRRRARRATGVGGIFLRTKDPRALAAWYRRHLGIRIEGQVAVWEWTTPGRRGRVGATLWAALADDDREWGPRRPTAMVNYRVEDLDRLLRQLRREGVPVDDRVDESKYGRFGWAVDPDGNRVELWEPPRRYRSPERHVPME